MRLVTVLRNAVVLLVITMALVNGQNFPNMMGNPLMPQSPMGQNMFNQPNGFMPQNMFPAVPQPPGMSNPFGSNLPGSQGPTQNSFGPPFSSMPMFQGPTSPQAPALNPTPQDFNTGSTNPQNNPQVLSPQDFSFGSPTPQSNPVPNSPGPVTSQGPAVNSPGLQDPNASSSAPQSNAQAGPPPESTSTLPQGSATTSNLQNPQSSSSGGSNPASPQPKHYFRRRRGPPRLAAYRVGRGPPQNARYRSLHNRNRPPQVTHQQQGDPLKGRRIVCIFNNRHSSRRGLTPANIDPTLCTHLNYEFAILDPKTYEMMTGDPELDIEENFFQQAVDLKKRNKNLKVMLALGGWNDSTKKYSELAADPDKRKNFIQQAISFLKAHEFDGMDFAWEYPNCWQGALGVNPADKVNFVTLLGEMKPQFKENGLILSVSVGAIKREVEAAYDVPAIAKLVDFISVMTYDMHGPWEKVTGHHTQFESLPGDADPDLNVKGGMQVWIDKGAPKNKLNMGLAFYGKTFKLADPENSGMGAPAAGIGNAGPVSGEGGFLLYNELCQFLNSGNWTEKEEKQVGFYAHSIVGAKDQWACYDPPMMMVRKAKFVVESGLGGVLLKDLSGDDYKGTCFSMPFPLLKMVRLEMVQRVKKMNG